MKRTNTKCTGVMFLKLTVIGLFYFILLVVGCKSKTKIQASKSTEYKTKMTVLKKIDTVNVYDLDGNVVRYEYRTYYDTLYRKKDMN